MQKSISNEPMNISIVMRHSYSDGMEAIPFLSARNAEEWMEKDIQCAAKMLEEQGYTPNIYGQGVEAKGQESISYDYWLDTDQAFLDEPESPITKSFCIVITSCYCGDRCGTCAYPFYSADNARAWIAKEVKHAKRVIRSMGYMPFLAGHGDISQVLARESGEIHFSAWLCEADGLMDSEVEKESKPEDDFACYEEPFTGARFSKAEWLAWYDKNGNKENFSSPEDWWKEMLRMSLLVPENDKKAVKKEPEKKAEQTAEQETDHVERKQYRVAWQKCDMCGKEFPIAYCSDGTYEYVGEDTICCCESEYSPCDGEPSLAEWLESLKDETDKPHRYQVFLKADYVRDAQAYLGDSLSDDIDLYDEEHEGYWCDISGNILMMQGCADSVEEILEEAQRLYPDASANMFLVYEMPADEAAYREINIADGANGKWEVLD